ncbi:hypothetical protein V8J88_24040 [Massilia sp. W12]|uniref:hypothetical protein n=1 Tax=Massilia sp. W12 TaxID=3126507 RepID=UPI0030D07709
MGWFARWRARGAPCLRPAQLPAPDTPQLAHLCATIRACRNPAQLLPLLEDVNGWVREAALAASAACPDARFIPGVCGRLNDWAPEVRLAARIALRAHLQTRYAADWLAQWPRLRALHHCQREQHRFAVWEVEQLLLQAPDLLRTRALQPQADAAARREWLWLAAQAGAVSLEQRLQVCIESADPLLAGCFCAWLMELPAAARAPWLARAANGPSCMRAACARAHGRICAHAQNPLHPAP